MSSNQVAFSTVSRYSTFFLNLDNSPYLGNDNNPKTYKMGTTASAIGANSVLPPVPPQATSTTNSTEADSKKTATTKMQAPTGSGFLPKVFNDPLGAAIFGLGSLMAGALFGLLGLFRGKAAHA
jgi:hypothetical protein